MSSKLKEHLKLVANLNLVFENNVYYQNLGNREKDGPFCSCCFDNEEKLIRLHNNLDQNDSNLYYCPKCKIKVFLK